jgi:Methyltransferase domain
MEGFVMDCFWEIITEPVLMAIKPRSIVEIGSEEGISTRKLLTYCERHGAVLHAIDPEPRFDVAAWQRQYGNRFVMHQAKSLQALPTLDRFDAVLLDGDHNWYTVFNELRQIEQRSRELSQAFPVILLHDIGWPYGRRDLYYNPDSVPEAFRQPYARKGLRPGVSESVEGGFNAHLCNAVSENTPRNGVLTGVEDFLKEAGQSLQLIQLPGFFGYGLVFPRQLAEANQAFADLVSLWNLPGPVRRYVQLLEFNRVHLLVNCMEMWQTIQQLQARSQPGSIWGQAASPF